MKYVIVTIKRETNPNLPVMQYPSSYKVTEVDTGRGPQIRDHGLANGLATEEMLVLLPDALADTYAADPDMRIVTEGAANSWLAGVTWVQEQPEEEVTDANRLQAVIAKNGAGIALSAEDLKAMDPDDPIRGITRVPRTAASLFRAR